MNIKILFGNIITLFTIGFLSSNFIGDTFAQATNATQTTKWTEFFSSSNDFEDESINNRDTIDVLYESDKTVTLESQYVDSIWKAVDVVKADGFTIDDVVQYETSSSFSDFITLHFMVIMSK
ncbi:MAG TPA: hypothetical protein VD815_05785 [Candidatus Saccharimonadales bacterium]|nr:hypothetical protein [Candidatus Saccharimonadales bacterium]